MNYLFDLAIIFLIISPLIWWYLFRQKRKGIIFIFGFILLVLGSLLVIYGSFFEPYFVKVNKVIYPQLNLKTKIVFVSDFHFGPYKGEKFLEELIQKITELNPDMVLLGGDFVYKRFKNQEVLKKFAELTNKYPCYAVLGNHDYDIDLRKGTADEELGLFIENSLIKAGVRVLKDEEVLIENNGNHFWLIGLNEFWYYGSVAGLAFPKKDDNLPRLVLAHNPSSILFLENKRFDLMISGHTHGGQITFPFLGSFVKIPSSLGNDYAYGLFKIDYPLSQKILGKKNLELTKDFFGGTLYVSSGIGESGPRSRLFMPPEIVLLEL